MSIHINAQAGEIAPTVLLPGDPLRARNIANLLLEDVNCFNEVRGMLGFTGNHGNKRISVMGSGSTMWDGAGRSFENVSIEVSAKQISAPSNNNNDYGIICRLQRDGGGYYGLISGDGFYAILRESGGDSYDVLVDWTASNHIRQGNSQNQLGLSCVGSKISLFVNDQLLAETSDSMYSSGDIGFTATSYELEGTEIHFDNVSVR